MLPDEKTLRERVEALRDDYALIDGEDVMGRSVAESLSRALAASSRAPSPPAPADEPACICVPCNSPQWGAPGIAHCAACCGGSGIEEYDPECPTAEHRDLARRQAAVARPVADEAADEPAHEFAEDVNDASMCVCGIPATTHDDVMARRFADEAAIPWRAAHEAVRAALIEQNKENGYVFESKSFARAAVRALADAGLLAEVSRERDTNALREAQARALDEAADGFQMTAGMNGNDVRRWLRARAAALREGDRETGEEA